VTAADNYEEYAIEIERHLDVNGLVGNPEVCAAVGVGRRNSRTFMKRFREQHQCLIEKAGNRLENRVAEYSRLLPPGPTARDNADDYQGNICAGACPALNRKMRQVTLLIYVAL